jgi:hypothetical protein
MPFSFSFEQFRIKHVTVLSLAAAAAVQQTPELIASAAFGMVSLIVDKVSVHIAQRVNASTYPSSVLGLRAVARAVSLTWHTHNMMTVPLSVPTCLWPVGPCLYFGMWVYTLTKRAAFWLDVAFMAGIMAGSTLSLYAQSIFASPAIARLMTTLERSTMPRTRIISLEELDRLAPLRAPGIDTQPDVPMPADATCAVCIESLTGRHLRRRLPCGHAFHAHCADEWLLLHNATCPCCRRTIPTSD